MELIVKTRIPVGDWHLRLGLDPHGVCWLAGKDLGRLIGKRFPHIPAKLHAVTSNGTHLAAFEILRHWESTGRSNEETRRIGLIVLNDKVSEMCNTLYGPRSFSAADRKRLEASLDEQGTTTIHELLKLVPGDHHVYSTLIRQAFGAIQIQRDQGPFAPHPQLVDRMFCLDGPNVRIMPMGIAAVFRLLGVKTT